jgi:heat-inducible transcriptional repressor
MTNLNPRQQEVLWATVNHYIATAEPVGSKVIAEGYKFNISPATIRNIMGVLEKSGLLYQPHTSSGRVPSNSGYRVYVDHLIDLDKDFNSFHSHQHLEQKFEAIALNTHQSLESLLRSTAQVLATFSGCIALITSPNLQAARIRHVQLLMVDAETLMLIVVTDAYHTASVAVKLDMADSQVNSLESELQILNNFLNAHLRDQQISNLTKLRWQELDREFQHYAQVLTNSLQELAIICNPPQLGQIFISGLTELLRQPEFTQLSQVQAIIQLLEVDRASLLPLFERNSLDLLNQNSLTIKIGSEISLEPIQNCTLISSTYSYDDVPVGSVGVLGPTRLDYERAIASVQVIAHHLSETINQRL